MREGYGNGGAVESVEKQKQLSHSFHRPLEISQRRRDSHIPTAPSGGLFSNPKPQDKRTLDDDDEAHADADRNSYRRPILAAAASPVTSRKSLILHEGPPRVWEGLEHFRCLGRKFPRTLNFDSVEANRFQAARRLKAGGGQDWPPIAIPVGICMCFIIVIQRP